MKIAVISDIHDNLANLEKFLSWTKAANIDELVCAGDVTNRETLKMIATGFPRRVHLVRGNMEIYDEADVKKYPNIDYLGRFGIFEAKGKKAGVCHEPFFMKNILKKNSKCDIIFYGHTHKPWLEKVDGITAVNPGTLGGVFQKATFTIWEPETGKLELKLLENLIVN